MAGRSSEVWNNATGVYKTATWTYASDGANETVTSGVAGQPYAAYEDAYSAVSLRLAEARDAASGVSALQLFASGQSVSQAAGVFSDADGSEVFAFAPHTRETISATGYTGETMSFAAGFGKTTIVGFAASGAAHDTLNLQLSMLPSAWFAPGMSSAQEAQALLAHATGVASTILTDSGGDQLTLYAVARATLSANLADFTFS